MVGGSSSSGSSAKVILQPIADKLVRKNHTTLRGQILTTLRGTRLEGFVTGRKKAPPTEVEKQEGDTKVLVPNPEYEDYEIGGRGMEDPRGAACFSD
jgi:hypothetical protein